VEEGWQSPEKAGTKLSIWQMTLLVSWDAVNKKKG
jgi:hypothetical protein